MNIMIKPKIDRTGMLGRKNIKKATNAVGNMTR